MLRIWREAIVCLLLLLIFVFAWSAVSEPFNSSGSEKPSQSARQEKPEKSFWGRVSGWQTADFLTLALVIIGAVQTRVFYVQAKRLRETIVKMDQIAVEQRKDTAAALKVARESSHVERAWVIPDEKYTSASMQGSIDERGRSIAFSMILHWRNGGRTPANNFSVFTRHKVIGLGEPDPHFTGPFYSMGIGVLGPNMQLSAQPAPLGVSDYEAVKRGEKRFIVFSRVEYADVYKPHILRISEYTVEVMINGSKLGEKGEEIDNVYLVGFGRQNFVT